MILAILVITPLLAACAGNARMAERQRERDEMSLARLIGERTPGPAQDCLDTRQTNGVESIGGRTLLYFDGNTVWRNDLEGQCGGLRSGDALLTDQRQVRLCRGDIARSVAPVPGRAQVTGTCVIGRFVPYRPS